MEEINDGVEVATARGAIRMAKLHELVWSKPMIHLATQSGITGTGLAKKCKIHQALRAD